MHENGRGGTYYYSRHNLAVSQASHSTVNAVPNPASLVTPGPYLWLGANAEVGIMLANHPHKHYNWVSNHEISGHATQIGFGRTQWVIEPQNLGADMDLLDLCQARFVIVTWSHMSIWNNYLTLGMDCFEALSTHITTIGYAVPRRGPCFDLPAGSLERDQTGRRSLPRSPTVLRNPCRLGFTRGKSCSQGFPLVKQHDFCYTDVGT
jgi:hypothetical protein